MGKKKDKKAKPRVRLGGMALTNGVLVHGPHAWACAIRRADGTIEVTSGRKRLQASRVRNPLLRGPARIFEALSLLPRLKMKMPAARLPMESRVAIGSMLGASVVVRVLRGSRLHPLTRELIAGVVSIVPAVLTLRGGELASYHGAEHIAIGTYEHGTPATKEHERCGGHLVGPLLVTTAIANSIAAFAPERSRRQVQGVAQVGAIAAATELFGWMSRNPEKPLARALAKPGHEIQTRFSTADPTPEQQEVADAALKACLKLERKASRLAAA